MGLVVAAPSGAVGGAGDGAVERDAVTPGDVTTAATSGGPAAGEAGTAAVATAAGPTAGGATGGAWSTGADVIGETDRVVTGPLSESSFNENDGRAATGPPGAAAPDKDEGR